MAWLSRILAPVALSTLDRGATQYAETLACHFHSELMLLHVVPPPLGAFTSPEAAAYAAAVDLTEERIEQSRLDLAACLGADSPDIPLTEETLAGDPSREIVQFARAHDVELIVMATHGYGRLRRFLTGSVTARVVQDAACPVFAGAHLETSEHYWSIGFRRIVCSDSCWFPGSEQPQVPDFRGSDSWSVSFDNGYGPDEVGVGGSIAVPWASYYFLRGGGCGYGGSQTMSMDGLGNYETHGLGVWLDTLHATAYRGDGSIQVF